MSRRSAGLEVFVTFASVREANRIAGTLLRERLIACANIWSVSSRYRWRRGLARSREAAALLKTTSARYARLEARLRRLHSYRLPAIVAWRVDRGSRPTLDWIHDSVETRSEEHHG